MRPVCQGEPNFEITSPVFSKTWGASQQNLVFRRHIMHPSLWKGTYDQHEVWAPFCMQAGNKFYIFYTVVVHPFNSLKLD